MSHPVDARAILELPLERLGWHDETVFQVRAARDAAAADVSDFAALREHARALKAHTLDHLDVYLERFEANARNAGTIVHWAADADGLCSIVRDLCFERGVERVVKSKSMLTEECGLNPFLERAGVEVVDTDLGERIVQLAHEAPSHIVMPAIHKRRAEIGALFHERLDGPEGESDPVRLTRLARERMRPQFLAAQAGITGVNFAVAETGSLVVVTNEGNADLGMSIPPLHIACMGIEKLIPRLEDLPVFLRLLARSATGQPLSAYTSLVNGPRPGQELHVVIVDNGRSRLLADPGHRAALACIRCGACLNTCPVYRRAGGHAYGMAIPGPIGAVLAPALQPGRAAAALPLASTLCGSCSEVCPVRIDLHDQLVRWRARAPRTLQQRALERLAAGVLARPRLRRALAEALRAFWWALEWLPVPALRAWTRARTLPPRPGPSTTRLLRARRRGARG